jgi:uncharacterized membrane protein
VAIPTDKDIDNSVANMLRFGVTLSALVVLAGGVLLLLHPFAAIADYTHFHRPGPALRTISGVTSSAAHRHAAGIIQFGLLLLIATPVVRVVFCVIGFARQRDRLYVVISSIVLVVLLYSLTMAVH